jgi:CBS domain-containing protein
MSDVRLVRDLMTIGVPTCPVGTPVGDIARLLVNAGQEAIVILNPEGHAVGVVSQDELVRAYAYENWKTLSADAIMREELVDVPPEIPITAAAQIMLDLGARVVYSMHNSDGIRYPAAMLSYQHVLRHMGATTADELADLGIRARRQSPIDVFKTKRDAARQNGPRHQEE